MFVRESDSCTFAWLMYSCTAVVGDEPKTRTSGRAGLAACRERACSLRINESVVVVDVGQKSGSSLNPVFARQAEIGHHRPVLRIVLPGSLQRILQGDRQGSALALVRRDNLCKTLPHSRDQNQTENQPRRVLPEMGVALSCRSSGGFSDKSQFTSGSMAASHYSKVSEPKGPKIVPRSNVA